MKINRKNQAKNMLIKEIRKTFNYKYEDAEKYADYLNNKAMREYRNTYDEMTVTRDKNNLK